MSLLGSLILYPGLALAVYYDVRWRRLPNWLTAGLWLAGLLYGWGMRGASGLSAAGVGSLAGGGVFLLLYLMRWMGAGDVKLAAAVGAWLGIERIFSALFFTIFIGGILAMFVLAREAVTLHRRRNREARGVQASPPAEESDRLQPATLPYGVAIVAGSLLTLLRMA